MMDVLLAPNQIHWTHELVKKFWDGFSQTRLREFSFSRQAGRSLLIAIDHLLPRNGQILDFGAGDGDLIRFLCEKGLFAAAYEPSENRALKLTKNLEKCTGFLGTVGTSTDKTFDLVLIVEVIEHILDDDLDNCLNRLKTLVRTGGLIIVTTPNNEDLDLGMAYCPLSNTLFHRWQHVRSFTHESLVELLSVYGFEEIATHRIEFNNALYVPYDQHWGDEDSKELPSHIQELRANRPVSIGGENNLLYIGRLRG